MSQAHPSRPALGHSRHLLWPAGAAVTMASARMAAENPYTTSGGLGPSWRWSEAAAAAALVVAAWATAGTGRPVTAVAAAMAGLLWLLPEWEGWVAAPAWVAPAARASSIAVLAAAVALVSAASGASRSSRRVHIGVAAAGTVVAGTARLVWVDPFLDPGCWRDCGPNPLVISDTPWLGRFAEQVGTGLTVVAAAAVLTSLVARASLARGTWQATRDPVGALVSVGGAALLTGLALPAVLQLRAPEDPGTGPFRLPFIAATAGAVALAVGLCTQRWREWRARLELTRLVEQMRARPPRGSLQAALGRALGDPGLRLVYWAAAQGGYVDATGRMTTAPTADPTKVTTVVRHGKPVAALVHDAAVDGSRLERLIGPAVRLWLENEQLQAATLAELAELKASRTRIVERSDHERCQLERNLHDGAQQRVVGLALLLRALRSHLERQPGPPAPTVEVAEHAERLIVSTLDQLRRIAQGIHPAALADGGLDAALPDLAVASTDVAVRIDALPKHRYPPVLEAAVYLVTAEAIADARQRHATTLDVSTRRMDGRLVVDLVDDAPPGTGNHAVMELNDRIGALDGHLVVHPTTTGTPSRVGTHVRLEVPCES